MVIYRRNFFKRKNVISELEVSNGEGYFQWAREGSEASCIFVYDCSCPITGMEYHGYMCT